MAATRTERQAAAARLAEQERELISLHLQATPPPTQSQAPALEEVNEFALRTKHEAAALAGIAKPRRWQQRVVSELAAETAANEARAIAADREAAQAAEQARLDEQWARFSGGDPLVVGEAVAAALRGKRPRAEVVETDGRDITLVIDAPSLNVVPEKMAALTPTGQRTVKDRPKGERNDLYAAHLGSAVLATVRGVVWSAPSIETVEVLVLHNDGVNLIPLFHHDFERGHLPDDWGYADPYHIERWSAGAGFVRSGRNADVIGIPPSNELNALVPHAAQALGITVEMPATTTAASAAQTPIGGSHE
jgi:hypothetical protein